MSFITYHNKTRGFFENQMRKLVPTAYYYVTHVYMKDMNKITKLQKLIDFSVMQRFFFLIRFYPFIMYSICLLFEVIHYDTILNGLVYNYNTHTIHIHSIHVHSYNIPIHHVMIQQSL